MNSLVRYWPVRQAEPVTRLDRTVRTIADHLVDLLYEADSARTVSDALSVHERAEVLVKLCQDVSRAALRRGDRL